jgi:alpha-L-fucosidase 2
MFRGLRARGGIEIDLKWENGKATEATLRPMLTRAYTIAPPEGQRITAIVAASREETIVSNSDKTVSFHAKAGRHYTVRFA